MTKRTAEAKPSLVFKENDPKMRKISSATAFWVKMSC